MLLTIVMVLSFGVNRLSRQTTQLLFWAFAAVMGASLANIFLIYAGLVQKIPYLHDLGITALELLPVFQFDAQDCPPAVVNYWGYAPIS